MKGCIFRSFVVAAFSLFLAAAVLGQNAEDDASSIGKRSDKENIPKGFKETLVKMQIEREKKDFQEMLDRGEEAAKLSDQVEKSFEDHGSLTSEDRQKIDTIEKLVKKIRSELGGSDDGDNDEEAQPKEKPPTDLVSGVKYLRDSTSKLLDELKKTSRFSISAAAILRSNSVLKVARFLRFGQ